MARLSKLDRQELQRLVAQCKGSSEIASYFNNLPEWKSSGKTITRQGINLAIKKLEKKLPKSILDYEFNQITDALVDALKAGKECEIERKALREEVNKLRNSNAAYRAEFEKIKKDFDEVTRSQKEFKLLQQRGEIRSPLVQ